MKSIIGKSFMIPEDIHKGLKQLQKERDNAIISAKSFMEEKIKLENYINEIVVENLEILKGHDFKIDLDEMKVTVIEKTDELK